jgi:hypothetical protein
MPQILLQYQKLMIISRIKINKFMKPATIRQVLLKGNQCQGLEL